MQIPLVDDNLVETALIRHHPIVVEALLAKGLKGTYCRRFHGG